MDTRDTDGAWAGLLGLPAIQAIIGYEWLMSGLTKVFRGGFTGGLADELRWQELDARGRTGVLAATAAAASGGILMNLNFHLANGSAHPWLIPGDGFDEGVDLDSLMPAVQLVLVVVALSVWYAHRRRAAAMAVAGHRLEAS